MTLSHSHRFIFIKTVKTAGTSIEIALSRYCGDDSIVTPIMAEDEMLRAQMGIRGPQNWKKPLSECRPTDFAKLLRKRHWPCRFYNHISAKEIRDEIGYKVYEGFETFCVSRNPWDRCESMYYWDRQTKRRAAKQDFGTWLGENTRAIGANWRCYMDEDGRVIVKHILRFENTRTELDSLGKLLGLGNRFGAMVSSIRTKYNARGDPVTGEKMRVMWNTECRNLIAHHPRPEIEVFGYQPP